MKNLLSSIFLLIVLSIHLKAQTANDSLHTNKQKTSPNNGLPNNGTIIKIEDDDVPFTKTEIEAEFPGGVKEWKKHLMDNLDRRIMDKNGVPNGTYVVVIKFIVAKDGTLSDFVAETDYGYGLEKEALRIIKISPKWTPAKQNGNIVRAYKRQPITFVMSGD
jgi:Gram-negative bacterial TonB protein C-terminal